MAGAPSAKARGDMGDLSETMGTTQTLPAEAAARGSVATPRRHIWARLGLALLIGALVGVYAPGVEWLSLAIYILAVLGAAALSIQLDGAIRTKARAWLALSVGMLALVMLTGAGVGVYALTDGWPAVAGSLLAAAALLVTVLAGFSVGATSGHLRATWGLALGAGLAAWIGVGLRNLIPLAVHAYTVQDPEGFALLGLAITVAGYLVIGVPVALLGGLLGGALRAPLLRTTASARQQ